MDQEKEFSFQFRAFDHFVIVDLSGSLNINSVPQAKEMVQLVLNQGFSRLLFNLEGLDYVDSSGLGFFTGTFRVVNEKKGHFLIYGFHPYVRRIFNLIQLDYFIPTCESEEEALEWVRVGNEKNLAHWQETVKANQSYPDTHFHLAQALFEAGQLDKAEAELLNAVKINPNYAAAYAALGEVQIKKGDPLQGQKNLEKALELDPQNTRALVHLCPIVKGLEKTEEIMQIMQIIQSLTQAVDRHPDWADLRNALGIALDSAGKGEEAREQFKVALQINQRYTDARLNYLRVLKSLGDDKTYKEQLLVVKDHLVTDEQKKGFKKITGESLP